MTPQSINNDNAGDDVNHHLQQPSPLSLAPISLFSSQYRRPQLPGSVADQGTGQTAGMNPLASAGGGDAVLARVRLSDISPYDGAPGGQYLKAVEALSVSLMRHNAAVVELGSEDAAVIRCGLESTRSYFRSRALVGVGGGGGLGKGGSRGVCTYRAGSTLSTCSGYGSLHLDPKPYFEWDYTGALEDIDSSPPCMAEVFKCMGKAARIALSGIARRLRLRSDVFNHLLDDTPLPANEASSSVVVANYFNTSMQNGKAIGGGKPSINGEVEKGLLTLICSDSPGLQVCDQDGRWYLADTGLAPGCLLLLTGKALNHATAGLHPPALYRSAFDVSSTSASSGRTSLAYRLMPQSNAILDCKPIGAAGHIIPQSYVPISVGQFMDDLSAEEDAFCSYTENAYVDRSNLSKEPSLRSVLSDPISGAFLEDAMAVSCGHSFGGLMLRKVIEESRCTICDSEIETQSLIPNHALRAAAAVVKHEDSRKLFHNAFLRKRRKDIADQTEMARRGSRENGDNDADGTLYRGVHYPFTVNEKVIIKGNRRTPDKFVGKEAVITSQCLNGWYLLQIIDTGESVRLQYRSLQKLSVARANGDRSPSEPIQNRS